MNHRGTDTLLKLAEQRQRGLCRHAYSSIQRYLCGPGMGSALAQDEVSITLIVDDRLHC
jgi:hypothetical protein